jgi:hypothetical protein
LAIGDKFGWPAVASARHAAQNSRGMVTIPVVTDDDALGRPSTVRGVLRHTNA